MVDILYENGPSIVADICRALDDDVSGSAVRAMLKRLEDKGYVARENSDRGYVYTPSVPENTARTSALGQIVRVFFNGSAVGATMAHLGCSC